MLIDFRDEGRGGERGRETSLQERNIDQLPLVHVPTGPGPNPQYRHVP